MTLPLILALSIAGGILGAALVIYRWEIRRLVPFELVALPFAAAVGGLVFDVVFPSLPRFADALALDVAVRAALVFVVVALARWLRAEGAGA